jgi:Cu(I)/Ag(I) efflux system membrane fusion protein
MSGSAPESKLRDRRSKIAAAVVLLCAVGVASFEFPASGPRLRSCGDSEAPTGTASSDTGVRYTCSMHPSVQSTAPGSCPICGMDLTPVTTEQKQSEVVTIPAARQQLIGVRKTAVTVAPMHQTVRAVGRLTYDESSFVDVNLRVRGWIAKLLVNKTGQRVQQGQPLFTLYSPELHNAQQDLLLALRAQPATGLANAARERLRLLDLSDAQIQSIVDSGQLLEHVTIRAPASGVVIEKDIVEGGAVEPGMRLFRIAALDRVWIEADLYEADFPQVRVGQRASITLEYLPGRTYEASVAYVYPALDPQTRTGRARLELRNAKLELRPGMYATVLLENDLGPRLQVPTSAVVYTGPRRLVFVDQGEGRFQTRAVQLGAQANDMYEVLSGLQPGDVVASSGVFLIAAEARLTTAAVVP